MLLFADHGPDGSMWAALLEKAWTKMKGNHIQADGGSSVNALHSLTGVPVFEYKTYSKNIDAF